MNDILDIFKKLKTDFEFKTGFIYKGLVQTIGAGFSSRLKEFLDKLKFIEKNAFVATADKDYLYLDASNSLPPLSAEVATGIIVAYGEVGGVISANTEIQDEVSTYFIVSDATIAQLTITGEITVVGTIATLSVSNQLTNTIAYINGIPKVITVVDGDTIQFDAGDFEDGDTIQLIVNCALVSVVANEAGANSNRSLNDVLKTKTTIEDVNTELIVLQIDGGIDDEDVEEYRKRVIDFRANPQAPFSKPNIIAENKKRQKTLKFVWVRGGEYVDGTVEVIALNNNLGLTEYEIAQIRANTYAIAPAQVDQETAISVRVAEVESFNIVIESLSPNSVGLKKEIEKNLKFAFGGDMYERAITQSNIEAVIYQTTNGAEKVNSFTLVSGWKLKVDYTYWKLNNVVFQ